MTRSPWQRLRVSPYPSSRQRVKNADAAGKSCPMWARTVTQGSADAVTRHWRKSSGGQIGPHFLFQVCKHYDRGYKLSTRAFSSRLYLSQALPICASTIRIRKLLFLTFKPSSCLNKAHPSGSSFVEKCSGPDAPTSHLQAIQRHVPLRKR